MMKDDIKQIRDAAKAVGVDVRGFGDYIEELKYDAGKRGDENFTYKELIKHAKEYKDLYGGRK